MLVIGRFCHHWTLFLTVTQYFLLSYYNLPLAALFYYTDRSVVKIYSNSLPESE